MNVSRVKSTIKDYDMSSSVRSPKTPDGKFSGMLKIEVLLAENVKACTSAGSANSYVILKLGDDKTSKDQRRSSIGSVNSHTSQSLSSLATGFIGNKNELLRTRVVNDNLNPIWGETFEVLLPRVDKLSAFVYSKNIISADDLAGQGSIDLSSGSSLQRRLLNHQTHKVTVDLEPQGALVLRITHDGEVEDVDFWFRKTKERLKRTRNDFFRVIVSRVSPYTKAMILKAVKDQEAVAEPSKSFFSLATTTQFTDNTASGASVNSNMTETEADEAIFPLTDYLNKNFEVLCVSLPTRMAQESIRRIWEELLLIIEYTLIPPLFGPIEKERRLFNPRQLSLISIMLGILRDFFHADGEGLGIPILSLETTKYLDIQTVLSRYTTDLDRLKRECELGIDSGRDKEVVLRLVRVLFEKDEKKTSQDKETQRTWLNTQIQKRKRTDN
jgi:hypothetical protein